MTKEELIQAGRDKKRVVGKILDTKIVGCIKEFGYLHIKAGPGYIQRAIVTLSTDYGDIFLHLKDIEILVDDV
jgi:hypothetical protein